jgi:hypothetical protein
MMKLWLLRPKDDLPKGDNPWEPWYDKAFGFIIRAETEREARSMAQAEGGDECDGIRRKRQIWTDEKYTTCTELQPDGEKMIVLRDFAMT